MQIKAVMMATLLFLLLPAGSVHALRFGEDDTIHFLQDVSLKGANGEALYLGYLTKMYMFGAGLYVTDGGYVLGVKGEGKKFYPMPAGDELVRFQKAGSLPNPLPPYSLGFFDYLFGYSLWIVLVVVIAWTAIQTMRKKKTVAASPPAT